MADMPTVNLRIQLDPDISDTVHKAIANWETVAALLAENKRLLAEVLDRPFQVVNAPLAGDQAVSGDGVYSATITGDLGAVR